MGDAIVYFIIRLVLMFSLLELRPRFGQKIFSKGCPFCFYCRKFELLFTILLVYCSFTISLKNFVPHIIYSDNGHILHSWPMTISLHRIFKAITLQKTDFILPNLLFYIKCQHLANKESPVSFRGLHK